MSSTYLSNTSDKRWRFFIYLLLWSQCYRFLATATLWCYHFDNLHIIFVNHFPLTWVIMYKYTLTSGYLILWLRTWIPECHIDRVLCCALSNFPAFLISLPRIAQCSSYNIKGHPSSSCTTYIFLYFMSMFVFPFTMYIRALPTRKST